MYIKLKYKFIWYKIDYIYFFTVFILIWSFSSYLNLILISILLILVFF